MIGQLADEAGVNVETVRYYERRGLLREPPRTDVGYRQYSATDLWRLEFIARAKRMGFTLTEIGSLLDSEGGGGAEDVASLARAKIVALDEHRRGLDETRSRLERLIVVCRDPDSEDCTALRLP
jgi:MerR family mercuric resistance operon transcriptional regulator